MKADVHKYWALASHSSKLCKYQASYLRNSTIGQKLSMTYREARIQQTKLAQRISGSGHVHISWEFLFLSIFLWRIQHILFIPAKHIHTRIQPYLITKLTDVFFQTPLRERKTETRTQSIVRCPNQKTEVHWRKFVQILDSSPRTTQTHTQSIMVTGRGKLTASQHEALACASSAQIF